MVIEHKDTAFSMDVDEASFLKRWKGLGWTEQVIEEPKKPSAKAKKDDTTESV